MGIFSRFADIINSNINALLDKAEDPEKLIRLIIQEMEDTLVEVRTMSAKTLADRKELVRKIAWLEREVSDWTDKAELALAKDREDLAKAALLEKHRSQELVDEMQAELKKLETSIQHLNGEVIQLQDKLQDARARQQSLSARKNVSMSRIKVKQTLYNGDSHTALEKFELFERKLDDIEAESDSYELGRQKNLKEKIDDLATNDKVDAELSQLKQKVNKEK